METESHENDWQQSAKTESQTGDEPVVVTIAESLAGEDHWKDRNLQLYDYIDTDALSALIANTPPTTDLEVRFQVGNQRVIVTADGTVRVE